MNYKLIAYGGGGVFSVFMDLVVPNILNLKDIENLYIEVQENQYNVKPDVFSYVLDQKLDDTYQTVHFGEYL